MIDGLDPEDPTNVALQELIDQGLVEYGYSDETGELMFFLTEAGQAVAEELQEVEEEL
jgi:hypothetical protein